MTRPIQVLNLQPALCPHCNWDVTAARAAGHEYCPQCGFEFGICRHCGVDSWETVRAREICCRHCGKNLHPDPPPLPDDAFWQSWGGDLLRGIKFLLAVITAMGMLLTLAQIIMAAWMK